ncbi:MAG: AbrB/MazE/SpoVT family DNA-binding domain-containing protein [Rickettsiaceae bacterium]|nr:AbrB/MazE/SpoVT family DNA-binding domain-containing protein [Rickettsiaceae bacterium]
MVNIQPLPNKQFYIHISTNGRVSIPSALRKAIMIKDGDVMLASLEKGGTIKLQPIRHAIQEAREKISQYFTANELMHDLKELRKIDVAKND